MPLQLQEQFFNSLNLELHNTYGPTEASVNATAFACKPINEQQRVPIGRPIANTKIYILNEAMRPVPIGIAGELYIGGDGLARGYLNKPELTAERFIANPFSAQPGARLFRTGDLVRYLRDGMIEYLGRIDHQVKIRGYRIELGEIEAALLEETDINQAVLVARQDNPDDKRLVAYIVSKGSQELSITQLSITELRNYLKDRLPDYMIPSAFVMLDKLPLNPNGKVDRRALPEPEQTRTAVAMYVPPRSPMEEIIAGVWSEILRMPAIGVHDNFFEMGGHSLLATQVVSRLRNSVGIELSVRSLFEHPTIAELAARIMFSEQGEYGEQVGSSIAVRGRGNKVALSFAQQRLWFLDKLEMEQATYNIPLALRLKGELNTDALATSINKIVQRHEVLRTIFIEQEGEPQQFILPELKIDLTMVELSHLPTEEREASARQMEIGRASCRERV